MKPFLLMINHYTLIFWMKLKHLYILLCTLLCLNSTAQVNLVPNPSFEDTIGNQCFSQMGVNQLGVLNPFLKNWYSSSNFGSPDCAYYF
jgi:hypothetical protein